MRIIILSIDLKHLFDQNERFKVGRLDGEQKNWSINFFPEQFYVSLLNVLIRKSINTF